MSGAVLITKRASRFWDGEIMLGACRNCVESAVWGWPGSILAERVSAGCRGERITVLMPRTALMTRYKGPLPPPTHLINEYP